MKDVNNSARGTALYDRAQASEIDKLAIHKFGHNGLALMTRAGESAFACIALRVPDSIAGRHMLVLCGTGNNGGDGYVVARCGLEAGWQVTLIATGQPSSDEARQVRKTFEDAGGMVQPITALDQDMHFDVVVDALLGIGLQSAPRAPFDQLIDFANQLDAFKVALDIPSGVDADTGRVFSPCFIADFTMTFIVYKVGLVTGGGAGASGEVVIDDLGVAVEIYADMQPIAHTLVPVPLPSRPADSHKGSFGHVLIAGAGEGMLGAGLLAGKAALRSGSGKVHLLSNVAHLDQPALYCAELMSAAFEDALPAVVQDADVIVLGPGLGLDDWAQRLFDALIAIDRPMVIDADGLTLLAAHGHNSKRSDGTILTPHPGEAARLLDCDTATIQGDRLAAAQAIAERYQALCVLKGAGSVIAAPLRGPVICTAGNAGMATAGMGDVLSGMLGALLGQGMSAFDAACTATWLHSSAADRWVQSHRQQALLASDIIELLATESVPSY